MTAALHRDLGADSFDLLDIVFRFEYSFKTQIPRGELFCETIFRGDPGFVSEGIVTDAGVRELRSRTPYADLDEFDHDRRQSAIPDLFIVGLVARYIAWKLSTPFVPISPLARTSH